MKRSYAQSEASLSDSDAGPRSKRSAGVQQQQQQQQEPASPENPHKLVEVSLSRRQEELVRSASATADLLPLLSDADAGVADDAASLAVVVPRCAAWFDYRRVHRIERLAFPQLFANSTGAGRTPQLYVAYRNYMIDTYRANPRRCLSLAACSQHLPGDIRLLAGVHAFLEHWGLINLQVDSEARLGDVPFHILQFADASGDVLEPLDSPDVHASLYSTQQHSDSAPEQTEEPSSKPPVPCVMGLRPDLYCSGGQELRSVGSRFGRNDWSDAELLSLLEAVELYKEDWGRIADRVGGGRTQEDCILQMLKLPILDPYLDGAEQVLGPLAQRLVPFGQAANPVMCTVAFLAASVDPRVASAAALAALGEYGKFSDPKSSVAPDAEELAASLRSSAGDIASTILSAAAEKSAELGRVELQKMRAVALQLVEAQMKKIEVKLRHYQELDAIVDKERECLDAQLQQVHLERQCLHQELIRAAESAAAAESL